MDDINNLLLPEHRGQKWVGKWMREWKDTSRTEDKARTINQEAIFIIEARVEVLINRWHINVHEPYNLRTVLNGITDKYNGLIYEEDGEIMEIDLFNEPSDDEAFLFGIGDTPIFNRYLFDHYPELLI